MVIGGSGRTVFLTGSLPLKAARSPGYRHLKTAMKKGQPEILADLIIRKAGNPVQQVFRLTLIPTNLYPLPVIPLAQQFGVILSFVHCNLLDRFELLHALIQFFDVPA